MTVVRVSCPDCTHDTVLWPEQITIRVCTDSLRSEYRFECPACGRRSVRDFHPALEHLLLRAGCQVEEWSLPDEMFEPRPDLPPITEDEIADVLRQLSSPAWIAQLRAASTPAPPADGAPRAAGTDIGPVPRVGGAIDWAELARRARVTCEQGVRRLIQRTPTRPQR